MLIVIFRHGPAGSVDSSRWPNDADRPLSPRGEERTLQAAAGIAKLLGGPAAAILTSPLERTAGTARLAAEALECERVEALDSLMPGGSYRRTLEALDEFGPEDIVILVGHEPDLGKLAGVLVFGAPSALPIKKAGACAIRFEGAARPGQGELLWFAPPRLLRRLAGKQARVRT